MRITKVKVDNQMVLIQRETAKGKLVFEKNKKEDKKEYLLPAKKKDSFNLSIKNKTLLKKESVKPICEECKKKRKGEKLCNDCNEKNKFILGRKIEKGKYEDGIYQILVKMIEGVLKNIQVALNNEKLKKAKKEDIELCLNHKFTSPVPLGEKEFILADLIMEAIQKQDFAYLNPYKEWTEWHIDTKSKFLKRSVENNKIDLNQQSSRKKALKMWEPEFTNTGKLDLAEYHDKYKIDDLIVAWNNWDKGNFKENGFQEKKNEYNRDLKKVLQQHQAKNEVFGKKDTPNEANRKDPQFTSYHLEVVKYLEHYFPIKKSNRNNSQNNIAHYLKAENVKAGIENQLINAIRNNILQEGKAKFNSFNEQTNSDTLTGIKRNEAFVLNLIGCCAFATNNIRNIIDATQTGDILHKDFFPSSLHSKKYDYDLFKSFFEIDIPDVNINENESKKTLCALRGSVQKIRNKFIHYEKNALSKIFNICNFTDITMGKDDQILFTSTLFKDILQNNINNLNASLAEQLGTGGVIEYYDFDRLKRILEKCKFNLCHSSLPFTPGFKKVFKHGCDYQHANKDNDFYDLILENYFPQTKKHEGDKLKTVEEEKQYQARYFLLKLIYNNMFLNNFTKDKKTFEDAVKFVKKTNEEQAKNSKNKNKQAFKEVREIGKDESIEKFMASIQGEMMQEINKKAQDKDVKDEETRINFENFLLQVFIKGFDTFLSLNFTEDIHQPEMQFAGQSKDQQASEIKKRIEEIKAFCILKPNYANAAKSEHISFFVMCKLLDAVHLSFLRNELIKFRQSAPEKDFNYEYLLEIIEICLLKSDQANNNKPIETLASKAFFEENAAIKNWGDLYYQSDNATPVLHSGLFLLNKYGTKSIMELLCNKNTTFKIKETEFSEWKKLIEDEISEKVQQKAMLHQQWVNAKDPNNPKNNKKARQEVANKIRAEYELLNNTIEQYNWLDNKLHFVHLKRLHNLTIEILSRMAGFVALWERDKLLSEKTNNASIIKNNNTSTNTHDIRNHIAHYNYLTKTASEFSLIELINGLRELMHYDRKLKNAITKAIIKIFDKHGMVLKLKLNHEHKFEVDKVFSKKIYHLGSEKVKKSEEKIATEQVNKAYCQMCEELLKMKK